MLRRRTIVMLAAPFLAALIVLFGVADRASAHVGHDKRPATSVGVDQGSADAGSVGSGIVSAVFGTNILVGTQSVVPWEKAPSPAAPDDCCCGSIVCHAGLASRRAGDLGVTGIQGRARPPTPAELTVMLVFGLDRPPKLV